MKKTDELWDEFANILASRPAREPWIDHPDRGRLFAPDLDALAALISVPLKAGAKSQSGRLAKAVDAWTANELRHSGFDPDEVWPRLMAPRVLSHDLALYLRGLPQQKREEAEQSILRNKGAAPSDARVLGKAYIKQVDVLIAQWARGPELLVSTKTMVSSFRKNLPNRFEESYGDAKNLRGRYPMAAMGFLMLMRSTAADEPGTLDRATDMLRKLQDDQDGYDATCLVIAEWDDHDDPSTVRICQDLVPPDLSAEVFLSRMIDRVLERTPIDLHVNVRQLRQGRTLNVTDVDETPATTSQE